MTMSARSESVAVGSAAGTELPADLDTSQAKLCYLGLATRGPSTLEGLDDALDLGKLTLLDVLGTLTERGHVVREDGQYRTA